MKTIQDIDLQQKTVLLRADYNVPLADGKITDDYRIRQGVPTLEYLLERGCRVVILSHLGRTDGQRRPEFSLRPVAVRLQELLGRDVAFASTLDEVDASSHEVTLLENIRFWPEETANDAEFARQLAGLGEVFVQDGFGVVHRSHASTVGIPQHLPGVAGLLLQKETETITRAMDNPKRPLVAILGGAKISDKIQVVERFLEQADSVLIGGAMANTFLAYDGVNIGKSTYEEGQDEIITRLGKQALQAQGHECSSSEETAEDKVCLRCIDRLQIPFDVAVGKAIDAEQRRRVVGVNDVEDDEYILDIGTDTIGRYQEIVAQAGTVIWNGPVGYTELPDFAHGSNHLAATLKQHKDSITSIIGGGDTAGFVVQWDPDHGESFTHVSTGGGAALDFMAGKALPGITALD